MASKREQFTLQFTADTSQVKQSMQDLANSFDKLFKAQSQSGFMNESINKAVESAKQLEIHLQKATDVNTGKLNLTDFNKSIAQAGTSFKELSQSLVSGGAAGQQAFLSMASAIAQSEVPLKQMNNTLKTFAQTLKNTIKWEISSNIVHGLESAMGNAVSYAKNLNTSLTNIRIVTGQTVEDMAKFTAEANKAAKSLSTTTKAYADASLIYYQQGDSQEQAAKKAAITIKAANSSFNTSAAEMSEYLTAVWNSYQVGADELERYVDIMAALGAKTATSLEEIATSMQKVAATANTVGVSMEQVSSIVATVSSVTRESAESIGTSYKTIFARIGDLKLGETLDDGVTLGQVSSQLDKIGVSVLDANGEMRDMGTIIEDLGSKWQTMSRAQQTAVAQVVAGKRQYTQLMALFENWDKYQQNMTTAQTADGALQDMADIHAESWEAASARVTASLENIYSKIINDQAIIKFTNGISGAIDVVGGLIDALGGMSGTIGLLGSIGVKVFEKQIAGAIDKTKNKITTYFGQFDGVQDAVTKIGTGTAKNVEQLEYQKAAEKQKKDFEELSKTMPGEGSEATSIRYASQLLTYKEQLLAVEESLSEAEKQAASSAIANLSQQQAAIVALKTEKEQMIALSKTQVREDVNAAAKASTSTKTDGTRMSLKERKEENDRLLREEFDAINELDPYKHIQKFETIDELVDKAQELSRTSTGLDKFITSIESGNKDFESLKQQVHTFLGKKIEAKTLDELLSELQTLQQEADEAADEIADLMNYAFTGEGQEGVRKAVKDAVDKAQARGAEQANIEYELHFKESSLDKARKTLKDLLNPKSEAYSKLATNLTKAGEAVGALTSGLGVGSNLVSTMTDETATLGDKINSIAGGLTSLISGFATGGWIGLASSAIGMLISGFSQLQKQEEEAEKKRKQERAEYAQNETNALLNEQSTIESLIQEYYTLEDSKKVLTNPDYVQSVLDLTTALTGEVTTVQTLIAEYGNLDTAIENMRLQNLRDTRTELAAGLNPSLQGEETDFIASGEVAGNAYYALSDRAIANIDGAVRGAYANTLTPEDSGSIMQKALETWIQEGIDNPPSFGEGTNEQLFQSLFKTETSEGLGIEFTDFFSYAKWILEASLQDAAEQNIEWDLGFFYDMLNENLLHVFGESYGGNNYVQTMIASMTESMVKQFGDTNAQTHFGSIIPWQIGQYASINSKGYVLDNPFEDENVLQSLYKTLNIANMGETTAGAGDTGSLPEDISAWLEELSLGIWTGPEELLSFYERGKDLMSKYPELKTNTTFTDWFNGLSYLENYSEVMSQLKEIDLEVGLADNENFKATTLAKMTEYADFSQAMDGAIEYLVAEQGYTEEDAHQAIAKLIQSWGVVPELANDFNTIIGLANFIAEQNPEANPEEVRSHLEAFYNEQGREVFSTVNFGQIQYTPGQGFDQSQLKDAVAYGSRKTEIDASNKNKAGAQALLDLSDEEIAALSPEQWDTISGEIDWGKRTVDGFNVKTKDDWLALSRREDREKYLQGIIDAENAAMVGEQGLLQTLATETRNYAASLQQTYDAAQTEDSAYQQAKAAIEKNQNALTATTDAALKNLRFDAPEVIKALSDYYTQEEIKILEEYAKSLNTQEGPTAQQKTSVSLIRNQRQQQIDSNASYVSYIEGLPSVITGLTEEAEGYEQQEGFLAKVSSFTDEDSIDTFGNSIKVVTDNVSNLQNEFNALNSIDISKVPEVGTQAYDALSASLKKAGKTMSDYRRMSEKDRVKVLGQAKKESLEAQKEKQKEIETAYATKYEFDASTTLADILATGDKDKIAAYEAWATAQQAQIDLDDQIIQEAQNTTDKLTKINAKSYDAMAQQTKAASEKLQKEAEQLKTLSDTLFSNIESGDIKTNILNEVIEKGYGTESEWYSSVENRAKIVAKATEAAFSAEADILLDQQTALAELMSESFAQEVFKDDGALLEHFASEDAFKSWIHQLTNISDEAKTILGSMWQDITANLDGDFDATKIRTAMSTAFKEAVEEGKISITELGSSFRDTYSSIIQQMTNAEKQAAQDACDAWLKTFNLIKEARQGLASGKSLAEMYAGDVDSIYQLMLSSGMSDDAFAKQFYNPDGVKTLTQAEWDQKSQLASRGMDLLTAADGVTQHRDWESAYKDWLTTIDPNARQSYIDSYKQENPNMTDDEAALKADANLQADFRKQMREVLESLFPKEDEKAIEERLDKMFRGEAWDEANSKLNTFTKAVQIAGESLTKMAQYEEAKIVRDQEIEEAQQEVDDFKQQASEQRDYADMASTLYQRKDDKPISSYLGDTYSESEYLAAVNKALGELGREQVSSLDQVSHETWGDLQVHFEQQSQVLLDKAADAGEKIVTAGQIFKTTVEGIFSGDAANSNLITEAEEDLTEYTEEQSERREAANNDNYTETARYEQTQFDLDLASSRQKAITGILDASTMQEMESAANALREAYAGADKQTQDWVESLIKARKAGEDGAEANEKLTSQHLRSIKDLKKMTKAQRDQYKEMLRVNNVTVKGHKSLDKYFDNIDKSLKTLEEAEEHFKNFDVDDYTDKMSEVSDGTEDTADIVEDVLPEGLRHAADEIASISQTIGEGGTIFDSLSGWLEDDGTFSQSINDVLSVMGVGADQIAAMQASVQAQVEANGSLGAVDWLQVFADANVDPFQFDSIIEALNAAMAAIQAKLAANGIQLDPPWTPVETLSGMGVGRGGGRGSGGKTPGGGKGGGGGGNKNKTKEKKLRAEDEIERYHEQNEALDRIQEKLDAIDKMKDRTYGKKHIAQLNAETDALKEQLAAQADLYNEANKWRASDQKELMSLGVGIQFDENGNISNYEEVMQALIEKQNENIERYNNSAQEEGDKLRLDEDQQWYEDAVQAIEDYEEALREGNEALIEMEEIRNQISELELEKITYKLEIETELNENDLDRLDYYVDKWEDDLGKQSDRFTAVTESIGLYQNNLANLEEALADLNEQHQNGTINEADYAEGMQDIQEQILDNLQNLEDAGDQLKEIYSDALELAREEINKTTEAMQHSSDVMESYISIMGLMGRVNDFADMQAFYDAQYTYGIQQVGVLKTHYDTLISARAEYDAKVEAGQELTEVEQANYDALQEQIRETEDEMLSATEATLEAIKAGYENTVNKMSKDLEEFMVGAGNSIAGLADQYAYFQEKQDRYVSTAKELFEVSKLNRDIENSLADATTDASKEALKALQEKINKQSELNELTEYDIQMNQLEYQLLLARIQLEEASSSKDTVRLTRDENGNYAYQYTADQDKVDEAMQQYEDVLQQINELSVERTGEIEQQMIDAMQNNLAKFNEIMTDETLSTAERNQKIADLNTQFSETMLYLQEQAGIAGENLTWNQEMIAEHFGVSLSEITASTAGNVNDSVQAMIDRADEFAARMNAVLTGDGADSVQGVWEAYKNKLEEVSNVSGLNYDTMSSKISTFTSANELAAGSANRVLETLQDTLTPLTALTAAWGVHAGTIENMVEYYEALAEAMNATMRDAADSGSENSPGTGGTPASTQFEDKGYGPYEVTMPDGTKVTHNASGPWGALAMAGVPYSQIANTTVVPKFLKGGLVDFTGLAQLDGSQTDPELVLNADDTRNMLDAVKVVRQLDATTLSLLVTTLETSVNSMMAFMGSSYHASGVSSGMQSQTLDQNVQITAEFPNVTNSNEIEEAFNSLVNRAAQFAQIK